jgi:hypothetical protein
MKYIIAITWNGEGYSYLNTAEIKEFALESDVKSYIMKQFLDSQDANKLEVVLTPNSIHYNDGENQGSLIFFKANKNTFGVSILCNINEVKVLNKKQYAEQLAEAIAQADPDDLEQENELTPFYAAYDGDYDYQFIKF